MKKQYLLMDDSSIKNAEFVIEENIKEIKNYTYKLAGSMFYAQTESYEPTQLGNTVISNQIIL